MAHYLRVSSAVASLSFAALLPLAGFAQDNGSNDTFTQDGAFVLDTVLLSAFEEEVLQSLGVSEIGAEEIAEMPVTNDISELVRKQPGVNLTGATATGQRGNQRQIDIRGMGPENTLILIDGKPVLSRTAIKMGRNGERDTRGDSNWVAPELIESIEVIRGPAAARYGSGAAGGVVNIITKQPDEESFTVNLRYSKPQSNLEGQTVRGNVVWLKPINDRVSMRVTANANRTGADDPAINASTVAGEVCTDRGGNVVTCSYPAGREGVKNIDVAGLLRFDLDGGHRVDVEAGYSRQGNIFTGDTMFGGSQDGYIGQLAQEGAETNVMQRFFTSVTHSGTYDFGESSSYLQYERTLNRRLEEGASGGGEGAIVDGATFGTVTLDNLSGKSEWDLPSTFLGANVVWTLGAEGRYSRMDDPVSINARGDIDFTFGETEALAANRDPVISQMLLGVYAEGNIYASDNFRITPSVRLDWSDKFGLNPSGSINATYDFNSAWSAKVGLARSYKAPDLYQLNPNYIYVTRGNGCPTTLSGPCYVLGNPNLQPEISYNAEAGISYMGNNGFEATLTGFYNSFQNKIQSGLVPVGTMAVSGGGTAQVLQWQNVTSAVVAGVEGSFGAPIGDTLYFSSNFTYMALSRDNSTGDPLSLVPRYTINASLEWEPVEGLSIIPSVTHYGPIEAAAYNAARGTPASDTTDLAPYTQLNLSARYEFDQDFSVTGGVTNLLNTRLLRSGNGANTFNEPGRAFYVGVTKTF
ncbi:MAG: FepA family TonB-dependent siderophore receptor [Pseudomonadota bacterium]|nr:FepA family TonB-dependent siderophore receptor [Pseudomonadota bacterium]